MYTVAIGKCTLYYFRRKLLVLGCYNASQHTQFLHTGLRNDKPADMKNFHKFKYIVYGFLDMQKSVVVLNFLSHISVVCHDLLIQRRRVSVFPLQQGQHSCRASLSSSFGDYCPKCLAHREKCRNFAAKLQLDYFIDYQMMTLK